MQIKNIEIKNFRLLRDMKLCLDKQTTLIVGRNNSGKTSLAELFRRLLSETSVGFKLEDFSVASHEDFVTALNLAVEKEDSVKVRAALPAIEIAIAISYDEKAASLGPIADFVIDLNPACTEARIEIRYELEEGKIGAFLEAAEAASAEPDAERKSALLQSMKELVPKHYKCNLMAADPNDPENRKPLEWQKFRTLIQGDLVTAHRGLDDTTHKDNDSLGKILSALFATADADSAGEADRNTAEELRAAVKDVQGSIDKSFNEQLTGLLPALDLFGYRLPDPKLRTETQLDVELLLKNHTRIRYSGEDGVHLPEAYNGLGARNLIYILLKLFEAFKSFMSRPGEPGAHLVFIEEPEAHLHPQMQEVFIQKLGEMAALFSKEYGADRLWPVQFVVTTHSPHMANKAPFDAIKYFLSSPAKGTANSFSTKIKDLKGDFGDTSDKCNEFLHQYMTLTRCDLLFADKVILIEGTTERLLLPKLVEKVDAGLPQARRLGSQYVAVLEVGGAYSHIFSRLISFLELPALTITDLDTVNDADDGKACKVSEGTGTSNASIRAFFSGSAGKDYTPAELLAKTQQDKTWGSQRLAYQVPEEDGHPCGRSFEDAFMLANRAKFGIDAADPEESAWKKAANVKKSAFALRYAIQETDWSVPRYIAEGLAWLAEEGLPESAPGAPAAPSGIVIGMEVPEDAADGK
ncbi:ATP-dependent nuclease [Rugamonas apoptosis]|uniref:ATP-dependent endonuclease n=1 Tax=Rugamonas apoptosis TaxID=2758570 RepID=A0A7W2F7S9_9BURK|nr:ATP-dependent endonuclease [Rugamonas apoptosis]MBA5686697.1 ATP-dependent endonuclease [Rugamonas apoptosis]